MSVLNSPTQDRPLDLADLLRELVTQGRVAQDSAEQCLTVRRSAVANQQHPLEFLAAQQLDDLRRPGKKLDLETLTVWLAEHAGQPYLRIDPLTSDIVIDLAGDARPDKLYLDLIFPTEDDRDQSFVLEHVREGRYITQGPDNLRYRWYLQIQPVQGDDAEWRLIGEARFPNETSVALLPGGRSESE